MLKHAGLFITATMFITAFKRVLWVNEIILITIIYSRDGRIFLSWGQMKENEVLGELDYFMNSIQDLNHILIYLLMQEIKK